MGRRDRNTLSVLYGAHHLPVHISRVCVGCSSTFSVFLALSAFRRRLRRPASINNMNLSGSESRFIRGQVDR